MSKEAKKKNGKKVVPVSSTRSGLVVFLFFFFCQGNFLTKCKEYIIYFFISPLNSQIKFVILIIVNHTILIMLVQII